MTTIPGSVTFSDCRRLLELYGVAMAERPVTLAPTDEAPEVLKTIGHDLPITDGGTVYLPPTMVDPLGTADAFGLYKLTLLHQLAFRSIGTHRFCREVAEERIRGLTIPRAAPAGGLRTRTAFDNFFDACRRPFLARWVFGVLEDVRADAWLHRSYPGIRESLAAQLEAAARTRPVALRLPQRQALTEALLQLSLGRDPRAEAADEKARRDLGPVVARIAECVDVVRRDDADVYDTVEQTLACCRVLEGRRSTARTDAERWNRLAGPPIDVDLDTERSDPSPKAEDLPEAVSLRAPLRPEVMQRLTQLEELAAEIEALSPDQTAFPIDLPVDLPDDDALDVRTIQEAAGPVAGDRTATDLPPSRGDDDAATAERIAELESRAADLRHDLGLRSEAASADSDVWLYDEWDHQRNEYRRQWCHLRHRPLVEKDTASLHQALADSASLRWQVRRSFELLRPEMLRRVRRLDDGEEVDLDAAIETLIDRRAGAQLDDRVYTQRRKIERDVAAVFLVDLSASTDSEIPIERELDPQAPAPKPGPDYTGILGDEDDWLLFTGDRAGGRRRRVIDVEREAVLLMAESLETLGDAYAIYGFSGFGRKHVDLFVAKDFEDRYGEGVRARLAGMKPERSTRMGPAIRHALENLQRRDARIKALIVISDGYPQDYDYGEDRASRTYGIQDTMMALRECEKKGVHTFCITVDPAGHDYLREMCPDRKYMVIDDVAALPAELPKVYRGLTT